MACKAVAKRPARCSRRKKSVWDTGRFVEASESKRAEEELRASEEKYRTIVENSNEGILVTDQDFNITYSNQKFADMVGYTIEELLSGTLFKFIDSGYNNLAYTNLEKRRAGIAPVSDFKLRHKNGSVIWVISKTSPFFDRNGNYAGAICFVTDISERMLIEKALRESESSLALAQKIARLGSWERDLKTNEMKWSEEAYNIYGVKSGEFIPDYKSFISFVHPEDRDIPMRLSSVAIDEDKQYSADYRIVRADGTVRYVHAESNFVIKDKNGVPIRMFGTVQDITERKLAEEALSDAKTRAELYLDLMGHDINNMHQIALGYLELARDKYMDAGQQEFLDKSIEVLQRSTRLIKNVRKLQKLQEGALQKGIVDVCKVLADIQREYGAIPAKPITLNLNGHTHCDVRANELLNDVFSNLVTNAIKHTGDRANISIALEKVRENDSCYYRVSVEDNGPGIPDNFKSVIFNRMLKGTKKAKGMGLGLYLVKSLVDSYAGQVWVEDRVPGDYTKGAKFVVMLPAVDQRPGN